ncbi:hypothetical protein [Marinicellulosiphila megalodicopiae]|uniref:hypothetical protein n=1 Tax=Marinicellulosiphila megalodicopiae TaxID=2724896 RepID=UPI003BAE8C31
MKYATNLKKQNGVATLMIVLVIGMILTVSTLTVMYSSKGTQQKQISTHALTHAQAGVWAGAEVFRNYFDRLGVDGRVELEGMEGTTLPDIPAGIGNGNVYKIKITDYTPASVGVEEAATAIVTFKNAAAKSSSQLEVRVQAEVDVIKTNSSGGALNFYSDVTFSGGIHVNTDPGNSKIRVDGDVNLSNIGLDGLESIEATGTITANSSSKFKYLKSNEDIILPDASTFEAYALGKIEVGSGGSGLAYIRDVGYANESITISGTADAGTMSADMDTFQQALYLGAEYYSAAKIRTTDVNGEFVYDANKDYVYADMESADNSVFINSTTSYSKSITSNGRVGAQYRSVINDKISAKGDVILNPYGEVFIKSVETESSIVCDNTSWTEYEELTAAGTITNCKKDPDAFTYNDNRTFINAPFTNTTSASTPVTVPAVALLEKFEIDPKPKVDVWSIQEYANYSFEIFENTFIIQIKNVNNINDGYYGFYDGADQNGDDANQEQRICSLQLDTTTNTPLVQGGSYVCETKLDERICVSSHSNLNQGCIGFNNGTNQFSIGNGSDTSLAPGVYFFEGALNIQSIFAQASIYAALDITTSGAAIVRSINYSTFDSICRNDYGMNGLSLQTNQKGAAEEIETFYSYDIFNGQYPTNYCEISDGVLGSEFNYNSIGNVVLGAGGYNPADTPAPTVANPDPDDVYSGGDISTGAKFVGYGTVMAGDNFSASGSTIIHGHLIALNTEENSIALNDKNDVTAYFEIDLEDAPVSFKPNEIPTVVDICLTDESNEKACDIAKKSSTVIESDPVVLWSRYL